MSDSAPSVPPSAPQAPASPPAAHLPAAPQYPAAQYPTAPPYPAASPYPAAPQYPAAAAPAASPHAFPTAVSGGATPSASAAHPYPASAPGASAGYPASGAPAPAARTGNPLGRVAFVIAVATFVISFVPTFARPFFYSMSYGFDTGLLIDNVIGVIAFFAYAVALVLGVIAARRPAPHILAGIAIGVAGTGVLGFVSSFVSMIALYTFV